MPTQEEITQVGEQLKKEFNEMPGELLDDCARVGALLRAGFGDDKFKAALAKLESLMLSHVDSKLQQGVRARFSGDARKKLIGDTAQAGAFYGKGRDEIVTKVKPLTTAGQNPFKKVLTTVLDQYELPLGYANGQNEVGHPRYYYVGFLESAEAFLGNIQKGFHWKDIGVAPAHGEYTHRMQWFVVAESGLLGNKNRVGAVFKGVGAFRGKSEKKDRFGQTELWARLCDRPRGPKTMSDDDGVVAETADDCRAPENMNLGLTGLRFQQDYPILNAFLSGRLAKRETEFGTDTETAPMEKAMRIYYARKKYNKDYAQLSHLEKGEVDDAVGKGKPNVWVRE